MKTTAFVICGTCLSWAACASPSGLTVKHFALAGTGQSACFSATAPITCPAPGSPFSRQDAQNGSPRLSYKDNGDGTVTDTVTGLVWSKTPFAPQSFASATAGAKAFRGGGHDDWRLPSIKELFSLMDFRGRFGVSAASSTPFIDTTAFDFSYGCAGTTVGDRFIDVQVWSATRYVGVTGPGGDATVFGVNFADGRIKGYPLSEPGSGGSVDHLMWVRYVRGPAYGINDLVDQGDGTIWDRSTGLDWQRADDGVARDWGGALSACGQLTLAGHTDWFLPDAKQLQSIVDYTRAPSVTGTAAIDPLFVTKDRAAYFWSATTLLDGPDDTAASKAAYVAFGPALGWLAVPPGSQDLKLVDIHGAGAQRVDPKSGDPSAFPHGFGPQGDDVRILNAVRCVRRHTGQGNGQGRAASSALASSPAPASGTTARPSSRRPGRARALAEEIEDS